MVRTLRAMPGVTCVEPQGAFYAFPDIAAFLGQRTPAGQVITDDVALCQYLIEEGRIALVPGSAFFAPGFVRLSYATSQANIERGLARMALALSALK
jgi:aspartate/methionine/tyrosine aminotransferase